MNKTILMGLIIGVIATTMVSTSAIPASADHKAPAQGGINNADDNVHENTGPKQDSVFHEGTCQGGHSTNALGAVGCNDVGDPGNSDDNRQDEPPARAH